MKKDDLKIEEESTKLTPEEQKRLEDDLLIYYHLFFL